ncbi:FdhF/YdeP family oxidoreductase [Oxalicibacterium faecigallinarum]|uniref:Oxidoreductase alpha (Molybdopterin) subunit n=1 Tax=Oxalicibacterium faecigallinarum TaxID=573741 RepID=A0A8J3F5W5_9BURK|nr:FdhF/YdeP family oxidoreductase [Oxalicibacterium faecigallinarum]GGI18366.1 oxidoreductase alpha (molybdopterin) subunit [Oxalicibacterium faecigallinarum]
MSQIDIPEKAHFTDDLEPAGGWGSLKEVSTTLMEQDAVIHGMQALPRQNKLHGFACVSCSWAKPADPHAFEFCENGAKATAWELTSNKAAPDFFLQHTVSELESWTDYELESTGRLTKPMRYDAASDKYLAVSWDEVFADIGAELRTMEPEKVVFYASGRASLETSYMYQLLARMYGNNNLPDSSNMCHETTSVALPRSIGVPVGTIGLDDFQKTDCMLFFGHNTGTNAPRMLHQLQEARQRDVPIITVNPIRERGMVAFVNPQSPVQMLTPDQTCISTQYLQIILGGDTAAAMGIAKWLIEADDAARASNQTRVIDADFIAEHTHGFEAFADKVRATGWEDIERFSGIARSELAQAAQTYARAERAIIFYGMGVTQQREGVQHIDMLTNLLLLRGNIGKPGAGICPIRGHSNVQGQRTVGITEKPELAPIEKLREQYGFEPPTKKGMNTVETCEAMLNGEVAAFIGLGGNFLRAAPDHSLTEPAWRDIPLTVQILTKLNRSAVVHGRKAYLLPCLGRIETDQQESGEQAVTVEDSTGRIHGSKGLIDPAANTLLSEPAIIAGLARHTLEPNPRVNWDAWVADYASIRDAIAETFPETFHDFNNRMWTPGGFARPLPARERIWKTENGKANFIPPATLNPHAELPDRSGETLRLMTTRGDNQFNTTVYALDDRFRGVFGTRRVLLMNKEDMKKRDLHAGDFVTAETESDNDVTRRVERLRVQPFDIPQGCVVGYFPELNPLVPLWHHAKGSKVPAYKAIPIRLILEYRGAEST